MSYLLACFFYIFILLHDTVLNTVVNDIKITLFSFKVNDSNSMQQHVDAFNKYHDKVKAPMTSKLRVVEKSSMRKI